MQAPTVAETPQIQALEPARPDQPRDDSRGFAKVLEKSLTPARHERPTAADEPERVAHDQTAPSDEDAPARSKDQTSEMSAEAAENAAASVLPAVVTPTLDSELDVTLALSGQLAITPADELAGTAAPVIAMPAASGPGFPLMADSAVTGATVPVIASAVLNTLVQSGSTPGSSVAVGPAISGGAVTDAEGAMPASSNLPASAATDINVTSPAPADDAQSTVAASPMALALAASAAPASSVSTRPTAAATKTDRSLDDAAAEPVIDDGGALLAPATQSQPINVTAQNSPLAPAFAATDTATKPMPVADEINAVPTTAMPQPTITPTTAPATAAGAALGNQTKAVLSAKDEDEPLDLQAKATTSGAPAPTAASTPATNAPTATGSMRETPPPALSQAPNPMERAVAQQVGRTLVQHLPNGERMMVLRLTPPELGTVRIEVIEHQGTMRARLFAEDDGVRLALERTLPQMRQELRASDAPIRELTLTDQSQFQRPDSQGQTHRQQDQQAERRQRGGEGFSLDATRSEPLAAPRVRDLGIRVDANGIDALA